ncbi:M50 family metallopeptidase [Vibrio aerogenes]|uniref:M50 family metallopeptidase n=1 Tax=Vibrio aerogenes TaxID=92172 RepID=UPI0039F0BCD1
MAFNNLISRAGSNLWIFLIFTGLALWIHYLSHSAFLIYLFKPVEVFFHEASHGLVTLLTGNRLSSLHLEWREGYVLSSVSMGSGYKSERFLIAFAGYPGASLFGYLLYASSLYAAKISKLVLILFCVFFFLYVDGPATAIVLLYIIGVFVSCWFLGKPGTYLLRFLGIYVMLNAIYSPSYLWSVHSSGDHITLSRLTGFPAFLFILIWIGIGLYAMRSACLLTARSS